MSRPLIIPFFFPNQGCPNRCLFCDQAATAGAAVRRPAPQAIADVIAQERARHGPQRPLEAAFFGGTFTRLPAAVQEAVLAPATAARAAGLLDGIRVSTHPLHVDAQALERLTRAGVETVELGLQSLDDAVLDRSGRGYDASQALNACRRVVAAGFALVVQLMPFLPGASQRSDVESARRAAGSGARAARLFPTVVLAGTTLESLWRTGEYRVATVEEAAERTAAMREVLADQRVEVIRVGLQASESTARAVVAGPYHPALGELSSAALLARTLARVAPRGASVRVARRFASLLAGHDGFGRRRLAALRPDLASGPLPETEDPAAIRAEGHLLASHDRLQISLYNGDVFVW